MKTTISSDRDEQPKDTFPPADKLQHRMGIDLPKTTSVYSIQAFSIASFVACSYLLLVHNVFIYASDQVPGAPQKRTIVLNGGTVHTVSGKTIENGMILFSGGKIKEVGTSIAIPNDAEVIDVSGKHVYPGLIDSLSSLGLIEIESVRATVDTTEIGSINPNVRAAVAFNPDSEAIPVARANGVLTSLVVPAGSFVAGKASLMMLDGWTWETMTLQPDAGMVITWPRYGAARMGRLGSEPESSDATEDRLAPLHELIREAKAYQSARRNNSETDIDLRLDSMIPVLEGKIPVLAFANTLRQIQSAVAFAREYQLKLIVVGGADAVHCKDLLKESKVPVVIASVYRLPLRRDSSYDSSYVLANQLQEAGIPYCIGTDGRFGASMVRNLPYHAATSVAFGLSEEQALRSITLSAAEIFGVADRIGSLDAGKDATLFVADGNILETSTLVTAAFIQGRKVDLSSKHTQLYEKYKAKYQQLKD